MTEPVFQYVCPVLSCQFITKVTCVTRIAKAPKAYLPGGLALYENVYKECLGCKGPKRVDGKQEEIIEVVVAAVDLALSHGKATARGREARKQAAKERLKKVLDRSH